MTEHELIDLMYTSGIVIQQAEMNIATIFFAYVACAYLVGKKLSVLLSSMLSVTYSFFLLSSFITIYGGARDYTNTRRFYMENYPDGLIAGDVWLGDTPIFLITLLPALVAWSLSLLYMHVIARK